MLFGLDTFGDITHDDNGLPESAAQSIRNLIEQGKLADQIGIYGINIGEHHRDDFAVSAPTTVLAGLATVTKNIKLGSGVVVLSSDDPIRVYQQFATIDALSNGRAEITVGRGSFTESFPLFGYDLAEYADLFEEKLEFLVELLKEGPVTWSGKHTPNLNNQQVYPKTERGSIPLSVGVGGSAESVIRAARVDANLTLAIIGGDPARFAPYAKLYLDALDQMGKAHRPIAIHSPGYIADTDEDAIEEMWPAYESTFGRIGMERGWPKVQKSSFLQEVEHGSLYVGSPETVAKKIAYAIRSIGASRFDFKYANGTMSHSKVMRSIELYGTRVIPLVQQMLAS